MTTIKIGNVPYDVHATLKARAAKLGMSLSDYLRQELKELARRLTLQELIARNGGRIPVVGVGDPIEDAVREERDGR